MGTVALFGQRRVLLQKNKCNIVLVHFLRGIVALFGQRRVLIQKNKYNSNSSP
jgi:hypothetical protein